MVEAGSTTSTWRLCGLSSLGKFSLGFASAKLSRAEHKSHNLRVDVVDPILIRLVTLLNLLHSLLKYLSSTLYRSKVTCIFNE